MKSGDAVEVNRPWAAQGPGLPPLREWVGGYEFVRRETVRSEATETVIVRRTFGAFTGLEFRFSIRDVRPARPVR